MSLARISILSRFPSFPLISSITVGQCAWLRCPYSSERRFLFEESDLLEDFTHGWGPGGSAVNTALNCVVLRHVPTKLVVKCHETRSLERNREIARVRLNSKLDELLNGEDSQASQERREHAMRERQRYFRAKKRLAAKLLFKAQEVSVNEKQEDGLV